jgi:hypothetical protein
VPDPTRINLYRHQQQLIQLPYQHLDSEFFFLIAGYGSGKTSGDKFLLLSLCQRYFDFHVKIGVLGITITLLKKTLIGDFVRLLISAGIPYLYNKQDNIVQVGAVEIIMIALETPDDVYAHNLSVSIVDELDELPLEKALAAFKAVQERTRITLPDGRIPFTVFTTTAQGYRGTYKIIEDLKEQKQKFIKIRACTRDNKSLPQRYVDRLYALYDENERLAYLEGFFVNLNTGRVYGDYNPSVDYVPDIDIRVGEDVMIGQDFNSGFSKGVALVKRDKTLYAIDNFKFPNIGDAPNVIRSRFPTNVIYWYPDATAKDVMGGYTSEIMNAGIQLRMGSINPSVSERIFFVNKMFKTGHAKVCKRAKDLDTALRVRQFDDSGKPEKGKGELAPDHIADSYEYGLTRTVSSEPEFLELWQLSSATRRYELAGAIGA